MAQPLKVQNINNVLNARRPHVFVICETKSGSSVAASLPTTDYDVYEEVGVKTTDWHLYKWGIVVGVRKDIQHDAPLPNPPPLRGRAIAIDLTLRTTQNSGFRHRVIGAYAPYKAWMDDESAGRQNNSDARETDRFWSSVTDWTLDAPDGAWTIIGDLNATLTVSESRSARSQGDNRYLRFLTDVAGQDLWLRDDSRTVHHDWTCKSRKDNTGASIIDRAAVSSVGVADAWVEVARRVTDFVPCTDHRAIIATVVPVPPIGNDGQVLPDTIQLYQPEPRLRYPSKREKHRFDDFSSDFDQRLRSSPFAHIVDYKQISNDDEWTAIHQGLTTMFRDAGAKAFGWNKPYTRGHHAYKPPREVLLIYLEIRRIGGSIRILSDPLTEGVSPQSRRYLAAAQRRNAEVTIDSLKARRKQLFKEAYALLLKDATQRAYDADKRRVVATLHGASSKRLLKVVNHVGPPTVVFDPQTPGNLVSDPHAVNAATCKYFSTLYERKDPPNIPKPWMSCPSVLEIRERVKSHPFKWPIAATVDTFRAMLRKGNARPSPSVDGWEKWCVKALSDSALAVVVALHNYQVMNSHCPDSIKTCRLTTIHKRGMRADLKNMRGIGISNFLHNSPAMWLNFHLLPYATEHGLIPQTQVAMQQGVQGRDLISFLSSLKCWADRHSTTVYVLKRDQTKGFDYLSPEGFYDAVRAYGLPESIIDLDRSMQANNHCFIRTAYAHAGPILINGVSKQGASLSPLKCGLTTGLGHRYINDVARTLPGTLVIQSLAASQAKYHVPIDNHRLPITMVECMDDSLIVACLPNALKELALGQERFQYVYGWITNWAKSVASILGPIPADAPSHIDIPTVSTGDGEDPMTIRTHRVALLHGTVEFLNTRINDTEARFSSISTFISTFTFPRFTFRPSLTILRRIVEQNIVSKARALLTLQPIQRKDAQALDKMISDRIHALLSFPYRPSCDILTLSNSHYGLGISSLRRINDALAIDGLRRDLNHHIPAYRMMAEITLADWMCSLNKCEYPLDGTGLRSDLTRRRDLHRKVPHAWLIAREAMRTLCPPLELRRTDMSFVLSGDIGLTHIAQCMSSAGIPDIPDGRTWPVLSRRGFSRLNQVGRWVIDSDSRQPVFVTFDDLPFLRKQNDPATQRWPRIRSMLHALRLEHVSDGEIDLLIKRDDRRDHAERRVLAVAYINGLPTQFPETQSGPITYWASDGSMKPAAASKADFRRVTSAVVGPCTTVFEVPGRASSILHGEIFGMIAAALLASQKQGPKVIFSDHLNSVRLVNDHKVNPGDKTRIRNTNARSYYRWLFSILQRDSTLDIQYTPGHQDANTVASVLNSYADFVATNAHQDIARVHVAPVPTFAMDEYTFYSPYDGWIECNIREHFTFHDNARIARERSTAKDFRMAGHLYNPYPPPAHPYTKAFSSYSAVVQLYARSGQLPTAEREFDRKDRLAASAMCRFGCTAIEDEHHIFAECPTFTHFRTEAGNQLSKLMQKRAEETDLPGEVVTNLVQTAKCFHSDSCIIWPLKISQYFYGHVPKLDDIVPREAFDSYIAWERFKRLVHSDWHFAAIRLAGRIWGEVQRQIARRRGMSSRTALALPATTSRSSSRAHV